MIGTHNGRLSDDHRLRQTVKNARNRQRRGGANRAPCNSYSECTHAKHGWTPRKASGGMSHGRQLRWPIPQ